MLEIARVGLYHEASRALQDRFDTRRLADRLDERIVRGTIDENDRAFVEGADMFFIATADAEGRPQCSYKGGDPGFVTMVDDRTLAFPNYDGNGMFLSMGNVEATHRVGLLFIDFERQQRMRVDGNAEMQLDDPLLARYTAAQLIVRVHAERIYPNCPRYIHKYQLVERSPFVPRVGTATPIPDWKGSEWARDVLPAGDPARTGRDDPGKGR